MSTRYRNIGNTFRASDGTQWPAQAVREPSEQDLLCWGYKLVVEADQDSSRPPLPLPAETLLKLAPTGPMADAARKQLGETVTRIAPAEA